MDLIELLDNPDYVNANTATKKAIFEKYSKDSADYVNANDATRQAIHEKFGLSGVRVKEPLPAKITDFSLRDVGNLISQSFTEANQAIEQGRPGRTPIVGPAVLGGIGELIKGAGAIGELATDKAQGVTKIGQAITQGAQEANKPAAIVGQMGSYMVPFTAAQKGIQATVGAVPYVRAAVNPATFLGSTGEMAAASGITGALTTPGSVEERMNEAALQAALGGGANVLLRGAMAAPEAFRQVKTGAMEGLNPTYRPGPNTAFAEVGKTYYPNKTVEPFMKMTPEQQVNALASLEASQLPSAELFNGFLNKAAQRLAPEGPAGGTLVPLEGKGIQAFTEQTTRDFFNKPSLNNLGGLTGNIGGAVIGGLTGGPVGALAGAFAPQYIKALEILAQQRLQKIAGLKPGFAQQLGQAQQTAGRLGIKGNLPPTTPALGYTPVTGPVNPTLYVNPQGQATTNLAGTQVNMNPGSMVAPVSPVPTPAAAAPVADLAQRYAPQPVAPVAPEVVAPTPTITTQPVKPLTVESTAGKTAEQLAAEQQLLDFINRKRGIVAGDPAATRANFANKIQETRQQLELAREENKNLFGDRATSMNERAGQGSMMPNPKDIITDATAVRHMINQTVQSAVKQQNKIVSYSQSLIDEFGGQAGITLDWKTAPDIKNMSVGDARKAMNKWIFDSIDAQSPELGLKTRATQERVLQKQAATEEAKRVANLTPEERAAEKAANDELIAKAAERRSKLSGVMKRGEDFSMQPAVNPTTPTISPALQALLDKQKAAGKYKPPGVSEMMTGETVYPSLDDFNKATMFDAVAGKEQLGAYIMGDKVIQRIANPDRANVPEMFRDKFPAVKEIAYDVNTGERVPLGKDWTEADPKPFKKQVEDKLKKRK